MSLDTDLKKSQVVTSEPVMLKPGVDLTSSMMQSIILSICEIAIKVEYKNNSAMNSIVDVGCANGFLSFGISHILKKLDSHLLIYVVTEVFKVKLF